MKGQIILTQPSAYLALCALTALVVAGILYYRRSDQPLPTRLGLASLRGLAVGLLAFLLLGPLLRSTETRTQRPTIVIAEDRSASVAGEIERLRPALDQLAERLSGTFDVQRLGLGERVRALDGSSADTSADVATDLAAVFDFAREQYPPELLAGVLVATDGIYNQGADPSYAAEALVAPVYALTLGDTTPQRDLAIREVLHNRVAYLGDRLELQVDVQATGLSGSGATVTVESVGGGGNRSAPVRFSSARELQTVRFEVEPSRPGLQRYRISVSPAVDERNRSNNSREIFVDVLDGRQRILILAGAPHPDVSALRQALDGNKNYQTDFQLLSKFDGDVSKVDLVIFHGLSGNAGIIEGIVRKLNARNVGRLFVTGSNPGPAALAQQALFSLSAKPATANGVTPQLNPAFRLFSIDPMWAERLRGFPPVEAPFGDYGPLAGGEVLLRQRVGRVETDYPLLALGDIQGVKTGVFAGEGLWRWRLAEFQTYESQEAFDGLILATVQYLALRDDKRPFRVTPSQRVYTTSEDVRLQGELYNASFQLVNEPDVEVRISEAAGAEYDYLMDKVGSAYQLRVGRLPAGDYRYRATTSFAGNGYEAEGVFSIQRVDLETAVTTADWDLLRRVSAARGGRTVKEADLNALADELISASTAKPVLYQRVRTRPLVDWPWLLGIVIALLSLEWFLRRRLGSY